jgi:hypothetical protein
MFKVIIWFYYTHAHTNLYICVCMIEGNGSFRTCRGGRSLRRTPMSGIFRGREVIKTLLSLSLTMTAKVPHACLRSLSDRDAVCLTDVLRLVAALH